MYILIKRIIRLFLLSLFAVWMITSACPASADGKWQKYELPAGDTDASPYMHYWVYTPDDLKPGLPLVVYLHSSSGMINSALRNEESGLPSLIISGEIPAPESIVLVPQHPGLFDDTWSMALDSVIACVEKVACDYKVDRSRISLTGFSLGGIGMWDLVVAKPGERLRDSDLHSAQGRRHQYGYFVQVCQPAERGGNPRYLHGTGQRPPGTPEDGLFGRIGPGMVMA